MKSLLILALTFLTCATLHADDLADLKGTWTGDLTIDKATLRATMEISDNKTSIITLTTADGKTAAKFKTELKLEKIGKLKLLTLLNGEFIEGDNKGEKLLTGSEARTVVYKIHEGRLTTISGFAEGDQETPGLVVWQKK